MSEPLLHPNQGVQASTPVVQHQNWTTPLTPNSGTPTRASSRATRSRPTRGSTLVPQSSTSPAPHAAPASAPPPAVPPTQAARGQLQATRQAHLSSYAARMRTGASLLMQPLVAGVAAPAAGPSNAAAPAVEPRTAVPVPRATASAPTRTTGRGRTQVNYTEPGSADEFEEEEEPGSEDSDFVASGGVRQSIRRLGGTVATSRAPGGRGGPSAAAGAKAQVSEVIQSYLGQVPPTRLAVPRPFKPTPHEYL
jgi:chromatin structure-remodeling complex subunit SFH1